MTQVMTGPMGRIAYFDARTGPRTEFPALNLPSKSFALAKDVVPSNAINAPGVIQFPRRCSVALADRSRRVLSKRRTPSENER